MSLNTKRGILIIAVALVAALTAGVLVLSITTAAPPPAPAVSPKPTAAPGEAVLVATGDIDANTVITTAMVTTATYPMELIPSDVFTSSVELVGATAKTNIFGGQVLLRRQFVTGGGRVGSSVNVPKDKLLVAFPSTDILNSTGAVQPGDHVDIMLSIPISGSTRLDAGAPTGSQVDGNRTLVAQTTLQNIEVFSTGLWSPPGKSSDNSANSGGVKIITFLVDPQEALILKYIKDSGGVIDLAVRSLEAKQVNETDPVNIDYLTDLYKFVSLSRPKP